MSYARIKILAMCGAIGGAEAVEIGRHRAGAKQR